MPPRDDEVQALVEQLSADLDRSVLVDDASLRLLAYSPTLGSDDEVRKTAILTRETPRVIRDLHFAQGIASATQPVRTAPRPDIGLESRVCVPIRCQGALFGYLWLIDADQSLTDDDCAAAERTAAEIGTAMYRRDELEKPQRELEVRLLEMLLGDDAAARDAAAHELAAGDVLVAGSASASSRCAGPAEPESELGAAERARLGLALDQFRRTLPRRHALSTVQADHGVLIAALTERAGIADLARRAQDALDAAFAHEGHAIIGYSDLCEHLRDAHRAHEHARLALRVAVRAARAWLTCWLGWIWARTACWPARPRRRTPRSSSTRACRSCSRCSPRSPWCRRSRPTSTTAATPSSRPRRCSFTARASITGLQRIEAITSTSLKSGADRLALHSGLKLARLVGIHPALRRTNTD